MSSNTFIERYFHSESELVNITKSEERDINSFFSYLENLHALGDKLDDKFGINIKCIPEFKLLRFLRNYFHHVDDIDEIRVWVTLNNEYITSHSEQIIIPISVFSNSIISFTQKHRVSKSSKKYQKKEKYISKELNSILEICDCVDLIHSPNDFSNSPKLNCDGVNVELGFDVFKFVYNITNIIADKCKTITELSCKPIIIELDHTYTETNNIPKNDTVQPIGKNVILTTHGYIYPEEIKKEI